ncbi:unnamed protein product [Somion occarium]|uniref:Secreted protein n=1 Tax=Somion occarium TaxID=3059160 RepID=A0ABP1DMC3_9APHY
MIATVRGLLVASGLLAIVLDVRGRFGRALPIVLWASDFGGAATGGVTAIADHARGRDPTSEFKYRIRYRYQSHRPRRAILEFHTTSLKELTLPIRAPSTPANFKPVYFMMYSIFSLMSGELHLPPIPKHNLQVVPSV